jgi:hypothetical protein
LLNRVGPNPTALNLRSSACLRSHISRYGSFLMPLGKWLNPGVPAQAGSQPTACSGGVQPGAFGQYPFHPKMIKSDINA